MSQSRACTCGLLANRLQAGIAAVEFAFILPLLMGLIFFCIFLGKMMMYYTVQHKAAANAVAYLASIPAHEMDNARRLDQAQAVTEWIVAETVSDFRMGYHGGHGVVVICDGGPCISSGDSYVTVSAGAIAFDEDFSWWSWPVVDPYEGIIIRAHVTLPYHGK